MKGFNLLEHIRNKDDSTVVVWLFNIGVEKYWSQDISTVRSQNDECIVNHMEEMNLLLTRKQDYLILRKHPDDLFLETLVEKGFEIPHLLIPSLEDESMGISELIWKDYCLINELKIIKEKYQTVYFVPYGVSIIEEKIAEVTGLELIGGPNEIAKMINNKIFARNIAQKLCFPVSEGNVCNSIDEVKDTCIDLLKKFQKVIIKYPTGASGKGLWVVESEKKLSTTLMVIKRICEKKRITQDFIVEGWYEKKCDLNYQIFVSKDGDVEIFSIKEQMLNETVYIGSLMPPRISDEIVNQCKIYGKMIGRFLYEKGYNGLLGVDAMITSENIFIPIIEINARFTLSTYISFLFEKRKSTKFLSFYQKISLLENDSYKTVIERILQKTKEEQIFCYVSETICHSTVGQYGRIFLTIYGEEEEQILELRKKIIEG